MNPADHPFREHAERTNTILGSDTDQVETAIHADLARERSKETTIQALIAQADGYARRVTELEAENERLRVALEEAAQEREFIVRRLGGQW